MSARGAPAFPDTERWGVRPGGKDVQQWQTRGVELTPFPPEFGREAVERYRASGRSLAKVSAALDVSVESLRSWAKQAEADAGECGGLSTEEREELRLAATRERPASPGAGDPQASRGLLPKETETR